MTAQFTHAQKMKAANREVRYRERVYPRLIERGTLTKREAETELDIMREIADDYRKLAEAIEPKLF